MGEVSRVGARAVGAKVLVVRAAAVEVVKVVVAGAKAIVADWKGVKLGAGP